MDEFNWNFPTEIIYGTGRLNELGDIAKNYGKKVFLATYARIPVLAPLIDRTIEYLKDAGLEVVVFEKIEPNPRAHTIDEGVDLFTQSGCDSIVALGGGSVIDGAKYIAATAFSGGKSWDYVVLGDRKPREYTGAYPIVAIPTVSAAGSEVNAGGVLTNWETKEKSFSRSPYRIPKVAIIDPEVLATLPLSITKDSCVDIFSHQIERYLSDEDKSEFADRITEGLILLLKDSFHKIVNDPTDLETRGTLALCSIFSWQGIQGLGRMGTIPMHSIEMPLSAHYDMPHGHGMGIVIPAYLEYFADKLPHRWAKMARRCFGITAKDDLEAAKQLAPAVREWFKSVDSLWTLSGDGIGDEKFQEMAEDVMRMFGDLKKDRIASIIPTRVQDMVEIYKLAL
ncbi:iron-containing alcohol dehydrogenase [Marinilabilia sp.]